VANKVFEIGLNAAVAAGQPIPVPPTEGALGSVSRLTISGGTPVATIVSELGTTGAITTGTPGYFSLNGTRNNLFLGDPVSAYQTILVEATPLQDRTTRSAAFVGLPGGS
jgi:hypothetical protein